MVRCAPPKYNARDLREPVTFERVTQAEDDYGASVDTWAAITGAPVMALVRPLSGGERWSSSRAEASATYRVVVRYVAGLTEKDRVQVRSRPCQIRFIANVDMKDEWLEIDIEMGAAT